MTAAAQRIVRIRRDYNAWVANETLEDYALRFAPRSFRRLSEWQVAATALGAVSFLALEAIGGTVMLNYGFTNGLLAILATGLMVFLTGLPISYYAAKYNVDMDLLARGAGFGYVGSTITSLIYASFTFIFFAIEAAIMALMLELYFGLALPLGYLVCALVVIPMVAFGVTFISRFQVWTFPIWIVLSILPIAGIAWHDPSLFREWTSFQGVANHGLDFDPLAFGAAMTICFSLVAQIGEQVDFLRFLPEQRPGRAWRWWGAMLAGGPGWIVPGVLKQLVGGFLAFVVLQHELNMTMATEPTRMYSIAFGYFFSDAGLALTATLIFVVLSQVKINLTNAYAGSLAWSNFFSRLTHSHPGRVVWLVFNVALALLLMEVGVFRALEEVLSLYSCIAIAWVGALVADLVINKPLGLSPPGIEFKRAHLYHINPVGTGATLTASLLAIYAHSGALGPYPQAFASLLALITSMSLAPLIAWWTQGRYYLARADTLDAAPGSSLRCSICSNVFEREDMAWCPAYSGAICSLCCTLDARCGDVCKYGSVESAKGVREGSQAELLERPRKTSVVIGHYLLIFALWGTGLSLLMSVYRPLLITASSDIQLTATLSTQLWLLLLLSAAIGAWWVALNRETRIVAQEESQRQTALLLQEIADHRMTDAALQRSKEIAESASQAKSRFLSDMAHEVRNPLNSIIGYARLCGRDQDLGEVRQRDIAVIHQAGQHVLKLFDDILDIARIEAGKFELVAGEVDLLGLARQVISMLEPEAIQRGLRLKLIVRGRLPKRVKVDELRLRQVLINLVANAIKFTEVGEVLLRIDGRRELTLFQVVDTGPGVAPEEIEEIFEPFKRGKANRGGTPLGVGLGLTISRMLVQLMGGSLEIERASAEGGAVFQFRLFMPAVRETTEPVPALPGLPCGYRGRRLRVLAVDDQLDQRMLLRALLEPLGFSIETASDGLACLSAVAGQEFDLVLLDILMPQMDGHATLRKLKAIVSKDLPVIAVTSNQPGGGVSGAVDMGAASEAFNAWVRKPVDELQLLEAIGRVLHLEWVMTETGAPECSSIELPIEVRECLLGALRIGDYKTLMECTSEFATQGTLSLPLSERILGLARRFQGRDLQRMLEEVRP